MVPGMIEFKALLGLGTLLLYLSISILLYFASPLPGISAVGSFELMTLISCFQKLYVKFSRMINMLSI